MAINTAFSEKERARIRRTYSGEEETRFLALERKASKYRQRELERDMDITEEKRTFDNWYVMYSIRESELNEEIQLLKKAGKAEEVRLLLDLE